MQGSVNSVDQAQAVLSATEDQVRATRDADDVALRRAEKQLDFDQEARDDAERQLKADQRACAASTGVGDSTTGSFTRTTLPSPALSSAMSALGGGGGAGDTTSSTSRHREGRRLRGVGRGGPGHRLDVRRLHRNRHGHRRRSGCDGHGLRGHGLDRHRHRTEWLDRHRHVNALTAPVDPVGSAACGRVPQDQSAFAQADRQVVASRTSRRRGPAAA